MTRRVPNGIRNGGRRHTEYSIIGIPSPARHQRPPRRDSDGIPTPDYSYSEFLGKYFQGQFLKIDFEGIF